MLIDILTLFPETFDGFLNASLIGQARKKGLIQVHIHNIRHWAQGAHRNADDRPYGGGPGMVLMAEPLYQGLESIKDHCSEAKTKPYALALSAKGKLLSSSWAKQLSRKKHLILVCGHYEGIDQRFIDCCDAELSIGDYITMGGETAAMVAIETISRYLPGVLGNSDSAKQESFSLHHNGTTILEWPSFTRPAIWKGKKAPPALLSGDPKKIETWKKTAALNYTKKNRPDLV